MLKILLAVQFVTFVVTSPQCPTHFETMRECATNGNANADEYACKCRQAYCCYRQICEPEGDGGKGFCKGPLAVGIPADQRHPKCATDGTPNTDKNACECNFENAVLCFQGSTCEPDGNKGKGSCKIPKCPTDGTPYPDRGTCECNSESGELCFQGQTCEPGGNEGKGSCKAGVVQTGPKPSGGGGGSSGGSGGWSGAGGYDGEGPLRCQSGDGSLLPSATICEDRVDGNVCRTVFSGDGAGVRSSKCDLPDLAETALKCAKTCKVCCERAEHGCADDGTFGIDCTLQKSKCKDPQWSAVMSQACPSTCGLCNAGACRDAIEGCASLKNLCRDFSFRTYMEKNCARTCQACNQSEGAPSHVGVPANIYASKCFDAAANCASFVSLCNDASWQNILRTNCARTCGLC